MAVVHISDHIRPFTERTVMWDKPGGNVSGSLSVGELLILLDIHELIPDDMTFAKVLSHLGPIGWVNTLSLREPQ